MDADLVAYLDQRFAEIRREITASAVSVTDTLRTEIAASAVSVTDTLRAEIAASAASVTDTLRTEIAASAVSVTDTLRTEIAASAASVTDQSVAREDRLRSEISAETARHIGTMVEDLVSKIELVAEGVRTVDRRLDRFSDEVREEFQKVDRRLLRLHARVSGGRRRRPGR